MTPVWIIGNGGHAKVVIEALRLEGRLTIAGIVSDAPSSPPVDPSLSHLGPVSGNLFHHHQIERAIIAIGANPVRQRIAALLDDTVAWETAVHPTAVISPSATIGQGVLLSAGSIVQPDTRIDDHVIINTAATVDHDCTIGPFAHIAPGSHLAANVTVGEGAFLGTGTAVIPGITIGRDAIIGAGSVVIRNIPDGARVAGNPARPIR